MCASLGVGTSVDLSEQTLEGEGHAAPKSAKSSGQETPPPGFTDPKDKRHQSPRNAAVNDPPRVHGPLRTSGTKVREKSP